jgi:hypothetical protein
MATDTSLGARELAMKYSLSQPRYSFALLVLGFFCLALQWKVTTQSLLL